MKDFVVFLIMIFGIMSFLLLAISRYLITEIESEETDEGLYNNHRTNDVHWGGSSLPLKLIKKDGKQ